MKTEVDSARGRAAPGVRARDAAGGSAVIWTATIVHVLRQPLSVVAGHARLMQRRGRYDTHALESIVHATQRLGHLVDELLDVASVAAGQVVLRPAMVDLVALVEAQVRQARELTAGHTLQVQTPGRPLVS
jgi:signal transduction histidine kinase